MNDADILAHLNSFITENKLTLFDRIAPQRTRHVTVVLEDIYQSHNASAVLRTCDLVGVQDIHVIEERNRYQVSKDVALGSSKWVDIIRHRQGTDNTKACIDHLRKKGYRIVATTPHKDDRTPETLSIDEPIAICFGTELTGLSDTMIEEADAFVRIPMHGFTESYNISVSAAIILYTIMERLRTSNIDWRLNENELLHLKLEWARKVVQSAKEIEERFRKDNE